MVTAWKQGTPGEPSFPHDFEIERRAVLQVTDIKTNRNKYYAIELHRAGSKCRVYTHYGRTDDLELNPDAGMRESRYVATLQEAVALYDKIYREKTSARKGYKELSLASAKIGSLRAQGQSSGHLDFQTLAKLESRRPSAKPAAKRSRLALPIQDIVAHIYDEATTALTSTVKARITAKGIETPLGILTVGQIEKGQAILDDLFLLLQRKRKTARVRDEMVDLSGAFYTLIPHRIGRSREAIQASIIGTLPDLIQKQETLQLMRDMLRVTSRRSAALFDPEVDKKYDALGCELEFLDHSGDDFKQIRLHVESSQLKTSQLRVINVYAICRPEERNGFRSDIGNERLLYHGSCGKNWVGILSRGILLPRNVVALGVDRTDAGWLGSGIYFGDAACTTLYYTDVGKRNTRFLAVVRVALGRAKHYRKITYGLSAPPPGFDSCHGVRATHRVKSEFEDDEYVVYSPKQQQLEYLVEFVA